MKKNHTAPNRDNRDTKRVRACPTVEEVVPAKFDIKELNDRLSKINDPTDKNECAIEYLDHYFKVVNDGRNIKVIEYEYRGQFIVGVQEYTEKCAKARLWKNLIDGKNPYDFFE